MHPKYSCRLANSPEPSFNRGRKDGCELRRGPSNYCIPNTTIFLCAIHVADLRRNVEIDMQDAVIANRRGGCDSNACGIMLD